LSDGTVGDRAKRHVAEARQNLLRHGGLEPGPGCRSKIMSRGKPLLDPLRQTYVPATWVTPDPSGQRNLNLGLTTLGVYQPDLGVSL
jgi:hypothetical protein